MTSLQAPCRKKARTSTATELVDTSTKSTMAISLDNLDILKHIISFVGRNQYSFVAATNRRFQEAYVQNFPGNQVTYINASTMKLAFICFVEVSRDCSDQNVQRRVMSSAASHGNLEVIQCLRSVGCPWYEGTCAKAAANGHLRVLKWCKENGCPWDTWTCAFAARGGHLKVLQWCRSPENMCPWDKWTCANAARGGHLKVLQWCRSPENMCPWDKWTCAFAARGGHLKVLQWCRSPENMCPWDKRTCANAARGGHLKVLQWCRSPENMCPWDKWTCAHAAHDEVSEWCHENGCPCKTTTIVASDGRVTQLCRASGLPLPDSFYVDGEDESDSDHSEDEDDHYDSDYSTI